jgi:hypothetical protein
MQSFLEEVVDDIWKTNNRLDSLILIVPSKRAGLFLLQYIAKTTKETLFAPKIFTIEEFVEHLSGIKYASQTQLLFELYTVYRSTSPSNDDSFYSFSKWANTLLQDFNEIDRYLISSNKIFSYLSAIQETTHWSLQPEKTPLIKDYLQFWNTLEELYNNFKEHLLAQGLGYQGLVYRQACSSLDTYLETNKDQRHLFIGFNALNAAESKILQALLSNNMGDVYWDIDPYFLKDTIHDAGYFIRSYKRNWPYYAHNKLKGLADTYLSKKDIKVIGVPKNVSQAKYVGTLLRNIQENKEDSLSQTAIVLGNESLLNPIINSIPTEISKINITMGYPLEKTPMAGIFNELMQLHLQREPRGWFYKDILAFLAHPYINSLLNAQEEQTRLVSNTIREKNWVYLTPAHLQQLLSSDPQVISYLFPESTVTPKTLLQNCLQLISNLNDIFKIKEDRLVTEYLARFHTLFLQINEFLIKYDFIRDIKSLQSIYKELISSETLDFYGEPLDGIQIMGMLESRNLDFETVIITSVNEGILPAGKSNNSFIPFDLKTEFKLPTYKEKDAVYTYHFYRLLQRAKTVYLLYNTQPDVLEGGEKSRFISQLLTDENKQTDIVQVVASPTIPGKEISPETIYKDQDVLEKLELKALDGFSPTSLASYIRNPIEFYKKVILKIKDPINVEETIAANTFGTIIHNTMEELYQPFLGEFLSPDKLKSILPAVPALVNKQFAKEYPTIELNVGKNLIALNVITRYIENYIRSEIKEARTHKIKLLGLEDKMTMTLNVPSLAFPVTLKGTIDRIDTYDGIIRIIDYKTGNAKLSEVEIQDWNDVISEPNKSKAFQLLCYSLLYSDQHPKTDIQAAIVPFKNLGAGVLTFATKDIPGSNAKNKTISEQTLALFKEQIGALLADIYSLEAPFIAKEV